jgi:pimeloyl-ACP methyl ester carboxylesterase
VVRMREAEGYHRGISGSQLEIIEGSGHMTLEEQPTVFNQLIDRFLTTVLPA